MRRAAADTSPPSLARVGGWVRLGRASVQISSLIARTTNPTVVPLQTMATVSAIGGTTGADRCRRQRRRMASYHGRSRLISL